MGACLFSASLFGQDNSGRAQASAANRSERDWRATLCRREVQTRDDGASRSTAVSIQLKHGTTTPPSADDAALRMLVRDFFAAYAKEDLVGFGKAWSAKAPQLETRRKTVEEFFARHKGTKVTKLALSCVEIEGEMKAEQELLSAQLWSAVAACSSIVPVFQSAIAF